MINIAFNATSNIVSISNKYHQINIINNLRSEFPLQGDRGQLLYMTINETQNEIIEEFNQFDDWMDKYTLLIDLGNTLQPLDDKYKIPQNIIEGCQSRVWLNAELIDGKVVYQGESDAVLVKGIVTMLIQVLSDHTPEEILDTDLYFIEKIGLKEHLSPTRSNGLLAMVKQMKLYALAFKAKMG